MMVVDLIKLTIMEELKKQPAEADDENITGSHHKTNNSAEGIEKMNTDEDDSDIYTEID